jgi:hypothetical protein
MAALHAGLQAAAAAAKERVKERQRPARRFSSHFEEAHSATTAKLVSTSAGGQYKVAPEHEQKQEEQKHGRASSGASNDGGLAAVSAPAAVPEATTAHEVKRAAGGQYKVAPEQRQAVPPLTAQLVPLRSETAEWKLVEAESQAEQGCILSMDLFPPPNSPRDDTPDSGRILLPDTRQRPNYAARKHQISYI